MQQDSFDQPHTFVQILSHEDRHLLHRGWFLTGVLILIDLCLLSFFYYKYCKNRKQNVEYVAEESLINEIENHVSYSTYIY